MIYKGTPYGKRVITTARNTDEIKRLFELQWFYRKGALKRWSADHEFCRPFSRKYLPLHDVTLHGGYLDHLASAD